MPIDRHSSPAKLAEPGCATGVHGSTRGFIASAGSAISVEFKLATFFGVAAGLGSMISFAPQAWQIIKTRDTQSISAKTYIITVAAFACWVTFGFLKSEWTIIAPNLVCFALSAFILIMTLLPKKERGKVAESLDPAAAPKSGGGFD